MPYSLSWMAAGVSTVQKVAELFDDQSKNSMHDVCAFGHVGGGGGTGNWAAYVMRSGGGGSKHRVDVVQDIWSPPAVPGKTLVGAGELRLGGTLTAIAVYR